ncbi:MAG: DUF456 domain-containing protein [Bacteroidales bacterium]|nr:DUF456 domain-containing protein [Bacteroidales bacterium]
MALVGIIGCVVPGLPGPPISLGGLICMYFAPSAEPVSTTVMLIALVLVVVVTVLDYAIPAWMTTSFGGHKAASAGALIGLFAGMFFTPVGMITGSILGAFLGEFLIENRGAWDSFKASIGAFVGFIVTMILKLGVSCYILIMIIKYVN